MMNSRQSGEMNISVTQCHVDGIAIIHTNASQNHLEDRIFLDNGKELKFQTNMRRKEMENPQSDV